MYPPHPYHGLISNILKHVVEQGILPPTAFIGSSRAAGREGESPAQNAANDKYC
jgi:hypothetical protein